MQCSRLMCSTAILKTGTLSCRQPALTPHIYDFSPFVAQEASRTFHTTVIVALLQPPPEVRAPKPKPCALEVSGVLREFGHTKATVKGNHGAGATTPIVLPLPRVAAHPLRRSIYLWSRAG